MHIIKKISGPQRSVVLSLRKKSNICVIRISEVEKTRAGLYSKNGLKVLNFGKKNKL